jgi:hypothetical protein
MPILLGAKKKNWRVMGLAVAFWRIGARPGTPAQAPKMVPLGVVFGWILVR